MGVKSTQDKIFIVAGHMVMILLSLCALAPFWLMVTSSLMDNATILTEGYSFFPKTISTDAYAYIMKEWQQIARAYGVTVLVTVAGTILSLIMVSMSAYILSQEDIPGVKIIFILVLIPMLFNGGIVSSYIIYTNVVDVRDTLFALLVPNLMLNGFNIILVRNYMKHSVPMELQEAAQIDGAGLLYTFLRIMMPLSKPIMATVGLLTAIAYWNDWTNGLYFVNDSRLYSIQLLLNQINNSATFLASHSELNIAKADIPTGAVRMAVAVIAILPIAIAYPFFQKYFESGITMGAVKG